MSGIKILCFGNEFVEEDSLAKRLSKEMDLDGFEFVGCGRPEDILGHLNEKFIILDVASGLKRVSLIDVDDLKHDSLITAHDFDLSYYLKLLTHAGEISDVKVVGIPPKGDVEKIKKDLITLLTDLQP